MMIDPLIVIVTASAILAVLVFRFLYDLKIKRREQDSMIELEKLVNCTSCGSLVPEGVNKCAFCGAMQRKPT